jgi:hypothetical protein
VSNEDFLKQNIDIRLSITDWLLLAGWSSAHVNEATPRIIQAALNEISRQVRQS